MIDQELRKFATDKQWAILEAIDKHGSLRSAAEAMGKVRSNLQAARNAVLKKAAMSGYAPDHDMTHQAPPGFVVKGTSTLYDLDGNPKIQWVKTSADAQAQLEAIQEAITAFYDDLKPIKAPNAPTKYDTDIIPWYQIGDAHIGMLAHEAEVGANFDLKIGERELSGAFDLLFDEAPPCERCVINDLGDATHYENMAAETQASGHRLDADGRFPKMISVYSRCMRHIVDRALEKYKHVDVIINKGNHSETNDIWMAELLRVAYGDSGRVHVLDNSSVFIPYRMGNTFVMVHHGNKTKGEKLIAVMASDFRQDWGEAEFRYIDIGHYHHKMQVREEGGATVEMWNTLAAKDRYSHDGGWRAAQSITRVDRSKTDGEVGRRVLPVQAVRRAIKSQGGDHYIPPERQKVHSV
tara:strand:+ start:525 stop:1751 length:1227 start_codon:yes stop_codon:yes gene_type:complete